jgi:putative transcriptional regulator
MRIDRVKLATELARREWRDKRLIELAGVSRATISAIKGGKSVHKETAFKISNALNIPMGELLETEV